MINDRRSRCRQKGPDADRLATTPRVDENNKVPTYPAAVADPVTITARLRMPTDTPAEPIVLHDRHSHMVRSIETSTIGRLLDLDLAIISSSPEVNQDHSSQLRYRKSRRVRTCPMGFNGLHSEF